MKKRILELRKQNKTYTEIAKELGCSKGTISYHCGTGQKEKSKKRQQRLRNTKIGIISKKVDMFRKVYDFRRNGINNREFTDDTANDVSTYKDYILSIKPICYLTGRNIDFLNSNSYHLDHIKPLSKGGDNSVSNLGLSCKEANMAKSDLYKEDFIALCKEVLIHNGYSITK